MQPIIYIPGLFLIAVGFIGTNDVIAQENPVLALLLNRGLRSDGAQDYRLPQPTLPDNAPQDIHERILDSLPSRKQSVEELMSAKVVAPFVFQHTFKGDGDSEIRLHAVDVWFVARGKLEQVVSEDFAIQLFQENRDVSQKKELTKENLLGRGIEEVDGNQSYRYGQSTILDRIAVEAVSRVCVSKSQESVVIAGMIDPRFNSDQEFPNRWRFEVTDSHTEGTESSREYQNAGFYTKITVFSAAPDLLFIESHTIFEEPRAWFGGSPSIKSKLPIVFQSTIRSFRRRLQDETAGK